MAVTSWKINNFTMAATKVMFWEAEEAKASSVPWNDGSSYPYENALTNRHGKGACVAMFDGHVEWWTRDEFLQLNGQGKGPNALWCDPATRKGDGN